ncbi:alpha/beta fold hydrolase [Sulfitobacter sp. TSTF-M16]|uniref:Alpha/beta fold hydrolase n=3 Tax=Sulfitobacter aestuariivivens TaxID=2766981 RepID=A0A927D0F6_9RHOB|nr:alpha/beta fold hydrolase [Sulfitobacter aestuariivivens]
MRRVLLFVILIGVGLWYFGPYEPVDLSAEFDEALLDQGVDPYLAAQEARFVGITEGVQKQVIWATAPEVRAPWSVLYIHGFSATAQEIRPVPDMVAKELGANLVFTRLAGHGRSGDALASARVTDWMNDVAEGLAIARKTGDRVLIMATSTGGTLAAAAAVDDALMQDVAGIVMISPNFGIKNPMSPLLTWPAARYWLPQLAGDTRSFTPQNEEHGRYWTTSYPSVATLPMGALVKAVRALDLGQAKVPALFIFSRKDTVVRPQMTRETAEEWGGPSQIVNPKLTDRDDPDAHVIAGDILSPSQNGPTTNAIVTWARGL